MTLLLALIACGCDPLDPPQSLAFERHVVQQVGGRFRDQPDLALEPRVAFDVEGRCPKLSRVEVVQVNPTVRDVLVYGTNLPAIRRVAGTLPDGKLVNAHFELRGDALYFPVACARCEIYFGIGAPTGEPPPPAAHGDAAPVAVDAAPAGDTPAAVDAATAAPAAGDAAPPGNAPPGGDAAPPGQAPPAGAAVAHARPAPHARSPSLAACRGPGYSLTFVDGKVVP